MARRHAGALNDMQAKFVDEYLKDFNAYQACIRAGYSAKSAYVTGSRLLDNVKIAKAVEKGREKQAKDAGATREWILEQLRANVQRAMQQEPVLDREGNPIGEYTYAGNVANKALELLGKHRGMFTDKVEHSGPNGGAIPVQVWTFGEKKVGF